MTMQFKAAPVFEIKALGDAGEIEGYGSTFGGEPDSYGDVVVKGAYAASLGRHKQRGTMPKMFWQHNSGEVIGKWVDADEDETGLKLRGQINMDVQRGREAYSLLKNRDIDGLSIGYAIKDYDKDKESGVWFLKELDLFEVSVVSIGANENATVGNVKSAKEAHELIERLKAGDRLTEREFEILLKGNLGLSNSQAERAARIHLKGQGEPADADEGLALLRALTA